MMISRFFRSLLKDATLALAAFAIAATASTAWAETLMMPKRDARTTAAVVVWGVTTQAGTPACTLDFGDGSALQVCTGFDRSYIAFTHTYALQGTYTAKLTVGAENATTQIQVFDPALFADGGVAGDNNRSLGINMAIQDGLRYLWTSQSSRAANFPAGTTTSWSNAVDYADTSLVVLSFENQGYKITANVAPTGIYEKYIVRRGLNFVISQLQQQPLGITPGGNNPCVIYVDCVGYTPPFGDRGYTTALTILPFAGSGALAQINTEVAGFTNGKTYGEIMQRMVNAMIWGQNDGGTGQGSWDYDFNSTRGDGSTLGWDTTALLDANAAGATVPAWVKVEYTKGFNCTLNTDGSFDYVADCNAAGLSSPGPQKAGIGMQGLFLLGETSGARFDAVKANINSWWNGAAGGIGQNPWGCSVPGVGYPNDTNKGCAYAMFNNFKGLKLQNVVTLPNVARAAGPGAQPAHDWYADYQDWLVTNQTSPATTTGGNWPMGWSCCASGSSITAAVAELILSPVALVAPDPILFSTVGLSPVTATNPVGTDHTVTAFAQASSGAPVPGVTITFKVLTGPNTGKAGSGTTGGDGKTTFTYHDDGGAGTDTIQAYITAGAVTLSSNIVNKIWGGLVCDVNNDGKVTNADLLLIRAKSGQSPAGANAPYDANQDGAINVADVRYCQLRLTPP